MKILIIIAPRAPGPGGRPYVMAQVDDGAYEDEQVRRGIENQLQDGLAAQFRASPHRLVWVQTDGERSIPHEDIRPLLDGVPVFGLGWSILEDRYLNTP